ncbi:MAG: alpha/beta hydrolase [Thermoleophilaceae bacterium]
MTRRDVSFESAGVRCAAWLYLPDGEPPHPAVVMGHGFSAVRDQRLDAYAERFAAAGLACLVFDYRHFGDSEGEPRQLPDIGRQLDDWRAAIRFTRSQEELDAERVALWGSSFSGGHVVAVAAEDPRLRAVVSQVPFTKGLTAVLALGPRNSLRLTAAALRDQWRALRGRPPFYVPAVGPPGSLAAMTAPEAEPGLAAVTSSDSTWVNRVAARVMLHVGGYRPYAKLSRVACPVLVVAADRDQTTPTQPAIRAAERAPNAELVRYPVGHFEIYVGEPFERAVADETAFLRRHLLGRFAPAAPRPGPPAPAVSPP